MRGGGRTFAMPITTVEDFIAYIEQEGITDVVVFEFRGAARSQAAGRAAARRAAGELLRRGAPRGARVLRARVSNIRSGTL